ncbi:MAG TPA: hypothetical protein VL595_01950 [Pseudonocardia sp.]|jgi:hypothetical protein|nr:hypothetical protein [Pseudonocardia sp.]
MFAKSGIIVTTAIAGLVAVSPLAYAACNNDKHHGSHKDHGGHHYVQADYHHNNHGGGNRGGDKSCTQRNAGVSTGSGRGGGLINVSNNNIQVPIQACNNNILSNITLGILSSGQHASSR